MDWKKLKVKDIIRLTDDAVQIELSAENGSVKEFSEFKAGQYINVRTFIDGHEVRRSYSICTAPGADNISIGVKEVQGGLFSTFANRMLSIGDTLECTLPQGNFINQLENQEDKTFVFFAAGSGITPVLSLIKTCLVNSKTNSVVLFYGNKNIRSIMFLEELEALKNKFIDRLQIFHVLSRQQQDTELLNGRIDQKKVGEWDDILFEIDEADSFFLCGPEEMISDVSKKLQSEGVDANNIHFELFTSQKADQARKQRKLEETTQKDAAHQVRINVHGKKIEFGFDQDDDNLLDAALSNGADLPFACKGGVCCTCKARLKEGEVKMYVNYGLEQEEIEQGFILTCQSYPITEEVVVDFDDV